MNNSINGKLLKKTIISGAKNLEIHKKIVDELNVFPVPDGDTGTNMSMTFTNCAKEVEKLDSDDLYAVAKTASGGALVGARGNSGVILSQLLRGFAKACKDQQELTIEGLTNALQASSEAAYKAVMKPTEGTILTVAREMAEFAEKNYLDYDHLETFAKAVIEQGQDALRRTPDMLPVLKEANVVDSGGQGLIYILEGAYAALTGKELEKEVTLNTGNKDKFVDDSHMRPEDITFGYCTEFIVRDAEEADDEEFKTYLNGIGDCVLVIKDDNIIKVHVHTDHPGKAFEKGLSYGPLINMKVDNMREMLGVLDPKEETEKKKFGFVTVSPGEGLTKMFKKFNVDCVISGGQTMNPSTQDFLEEIEKINAEDIFLFPNNGNIIMAANQAKAISEKNIHVVPTKTIPQCVTAILSFNQESDASENLAVMTEAIQEVKTGEVTYAVRDTKINGLKIAKDDIIGIYNSEIVAKGDDIQVVAKALLEKMADEDSELISIYYGKEVTQDVADSLSESVEVLFEDCDIEVNDGGQPLYYYILAVE